MRHVVYHYTSQLHLPWILHTGELRPGRNAVGGFPSPEFVWATTSPKGDATATVALRGYRQGKTRLVRFTLDAGDFISWRDDVPARHLGWTASEMARLERALEGHSDPRQWRCRAETLPRERWIAIESRSWSSNRWVPFAISAQPEVTALPWEGRTVPALALELANTLVVSAQVERADGRLYYAAHCRPAFETAS